MPAGEIESRLLSCRMPRRAAAAAGFVHGLLLALAFPPIGLYGFVFTAALPLVWVSFACRSRPLVTAFWVGVGSMPWWGLAHIWITSVSALGFFPLAAILGAYTMLAVWIGARVLRARPALIWLWPVVWVGIEFLRGVVLFDGYPWYLLAHPLADARVLLWPAAYLGTFAVSLLAALPAMALLAWMTGRRKQAVGLVAFTAAWPVLGLVLDPWPTASETLRVGIVQTNVAQNRKIAWSAEQRYNDWNRMRDLIVAAARLEPDLIVLPEAMSPGMTIDPESFRAELAAELYWSRIAPDGVHEDISATLLSEELFITQRVLDIPILIGGAYYDGLDIVEADRGYEYKSNGRYNSVFVIDAGLPPEERYDKVLLTPFGETMPYISKSQWLEQKLLAFGAGGMQFDLKPGSDLSPVTVHLAHGDIVRIATPVCFEATMPWVCRRLVGADANHAAIMINLTNDGWFGDWDASREHHMLCARWRSIETGVSMVRSANTGISSVFDQRGEIIALGVQNPATNEPVLGRGDGIRVVEVPIADGRTFYTRIGDAIGWICLAATAILFGHSFTRILIYGFSFTRRGRDGRSDDDMGEPGPSGHRSVNYPEESKA